jgi:hypothetical protein
MRPFALSPLAVVLALWVVTSGCTDPASSRPLLPEHDDPIEEEHGQPEILASYVRPPWANPRYLLFEESVFVLRYGSSDTSYLDLPGIYQATDSVITFDFRWPAGRSVGVLRGDSLRVKYDETMVLFLGNDVMDFTIYTDQRATYVRSPEPD